MRIEELEDGSNHGDSGGIVKKPEGMNNFYLRGLRRDS